MNLADVGVLKATLDTMRPLRQAAPSNLHDDLGLRWT